MRRNDPHQSFWLACALLPAIALAGGPLAAARYCEQQLSVEHGLTPSIHYEYEGRIGEKSEVYNTIRGAGWRHLQSLKGHEDFPRCGVLEPNWGAADGQWYNTKDNHVVYELRKCALRRLTGRSVRTCLTGKHIAFVGDSVTRYQYLMLAYFLTKLRWPARYHHGDDGPNVAREDEWGGWERFYRDSSVLLNSADDATVFEECDCFRNANTTMDQIREYRKLSLCEAAVPLAKCVNDNQPAPWKTLLTYEQVFRYPSWTEDPLRGLHAVLNVSGAMPDVVVFNHGFHVPVWNELMSDDELREGFRLIFQTGRRLVEQRGAQTLLLWKPTTACLYQPGCPNIRHAADLADEEAAAAGWRVYDAAALHRAAERQEFIHRLLWDSLHSYAIFYQDANDLLLNMLCDENCDFVQREVLFADAGPPKRRHPTSETRHLLKEKLAALARQRADHL